MKKILSVVAASMFFAVVGLSGMALASDKAVPGDVVKDQAAAVTDAADTAKEEVEKVVEGADEAAADAEKKAEEAADKTADKTDEAAK